MIQKLKDLMKIKGLIDDNIKIIKDEKKEIEQLKKEIKEAKDETKKATESVKEMGKKQDEFLDMLGKNLGLIEQSRKDLDEEVKNFKLQKTNMEKRMLEKSDGEISKHLERIKTDVNSYNELKREIASISSTVAKLDSEIKKFMEISQSIKAKDFELERHARELSKRDNEKLDLMRKIDSLQRLIGRERRRNF